MGTNFSGSLTLTGLLQMLRVLLAGICFGTKMAFAMNYGESPRSTAVLASRNGPFRNLVFERYGLRGSLASYRLLCHRKTAMIEHRALHTLSGDERSWLRARHHIAFTDTSDGLLQSWGALRAWNDDEIEVRTTIVHIGRTSLRMRHQLVRMSDGVLLARGEAVRVHIQRVPSRAMRPVPLTPAMRRVLSRYMPAEL